MKKLAFTGICILAFSTAAFAAVDPCRAKALTAAEEAYFGISGNPPHGTRIAVLSFEREYEVTVGIGDPEDGAVNYIVTFPNGCASQPFVRETR
jgi:hypothetical protein